MKWVFFPTVIWASRRHTRVKIIVARNSRKSKQPAANPCGPHKALPACKRSSALWTVRLTLPAARDRFKSDPWTECPAVSDLHRCTSLFGSIQLVNVWRLINNCPLSLFKVESDLKWEGGIELLVPGFHLNYLPPGWTGGAQNVSTNRCKKNNNSHTQQTWSQNVWWKPTSLSTYKTETWVHADSWETIACKKKEINTDADILLHGCLAWWRAVVCRGSTSMQGGCGTAMARM